MKYIGSVYLPDLPSAPYQKLAEEALNSPSLPVNGFSVQALTLFALARHCADEYDIAEQYVDKAIDISLAIGLNLQEFAAANGEGDAILQESWRRTWWTLYLVDGLFATISHYCTHRLQNVTMDVDLPCEDTEYERGVCFSLFIATYISLTVSMKRIPPPKTFSEYDNREFADTEIIFSSMTYLIDSIRILSAIMSTIHSSREPGDKSLTWADAKYVNWSMYLPRCKQEIVKQNGKVDETLFLAHLIANTYVSSLSSQEQFSI